MDPQTSTSLFLNALSAHPWQSMTNWEAAQAVQHSAFADGSNYRQADARAQSIVAGVWNIGGIIGIKQSVEDSMLIIVKPGKGAGRIAQIVPGGKYTLDALEWAAIQSIRKANPAAVTVVNTSATEFGRLHEKRHVL